MMTGLPLAAIGGDAMVRGRMVLDQGEPDEIGRPILDIRRRFASGHALTLDEHSSGFVGTGSTG